MLGYGGGPRGGYAERRWHKVIHEKWFHHTNVWVQVATAQLYSGLIMCVLKEVFSEFEIWKKEPWVWATFRLSSTGGKKRHAVGAAMGKTTDLLWVIWLLRYLPSSHIEKLDLQFMGKSVESTNLKVWIQHFRTAGSATVWDGDSPWHIYPNTGFPLRPSMGLKLCFSLPLPLF